MKIQAIIPKKFSPDLLNLELLSKLSIENHIKLYEAYVSKYNEINTILSSLSSEDMIKANQTYSLLRELKVELSFAWGGVYNHELYFSHLVPSNKRNKTEPDGLLLEQIKNDFGSFATYLSDLKGSAMSARGWVWTAWNYREKRLFNYVGDAQNTYPIWGGEPILALDVYEHAYLTDFGINRKSYLDAFVELINWSIVKDSFDKIIIQK